MKCGSMCLVLQQRDVQTIKGTIDLASDVWQNLARNVDPAENKTVLLL